MDDEIELSENIHMLQDATCKFQEVVDELITLEDHLNSLKIRMEIFSELVYSTFHFDIIQLKKWAVKFSKMREAMKLVIIRITDVLHSVTHPGTLAELSMAAVIKNHLPVSDLPVTLQCQVESWPNTNALRRRIKLFETVLMRYEILYMFSETRL